MLETLSYLQPTDFPAISRRDLTTLQVNLGYRCNQSCVHCHVNAGPNRTEMMSSANIALVKRLLQQGKVEVLDLTGGAPELHDEFRELVVAAVAAGVKVIDRCNLTILFEPEQQALAQFLTENKVEVVASLPCYSKDNVDSQRGGGVFDKSIAGLQKLNALGYAVPGSELILNLVYNPQTDCLPPEQSGLELAYKRELKDNFNIEFNALFAVANMPIKRFGSMLLSQGRFDDYLQLLKQNFQSKNLSQLMCRSLISVDWQGYLYDCDFNQQLGLGCNGNIKHLTDLLSADPAGDSVIVAEHCYGCTAGQGSSCGGAL